MKKNDIVKKAMKEGFDEKYYTSWLIVHFGGAMVARTIADDKLDDKLRYECMKDFIRQIERSCVG